METSERSTSGCDAKTAEDCWTRARTAGAVGLQTAAAGRIVSTGGSCRKIRDRVARGAVLERRLLAREHRNGALIRDVCRQPDLAAHGVVVVVERCDDRLAQKRRAAKALYDKPGAVEGVVADAHFDSQRARAARRVFDDRAESAGDVGHGAVEHLVGDVVRRCLPFHAQLGHRALHLILHGRDGGRFLCAQTIGEEPREGHQPDHGPSAHELGASRRPS